MVRDLRGKAPKTDEQQNDIEVICIEAEMSKSPNQNVRYRIITSISFTQVQRLFYTQVI